MFYSIGIYYERNGLVNMNISRKYMNYLQFEYVIDD